MLVSFFLMSMISGFPSGAKYIVKDYEAGHINKEEANHLLVFTHFANPLFVLGTCGLLLNNKGLAHKIFIIQLLSNIILGILIRPKARRETVKKEVEFPPTPNILLFLSDAINESMQVLIFMLGSITIFQFLLTVFSFF